jgi:hypothetical protein
MLVLVALAAVFCVLGQQRELTTLRAEQKRVLAQLAAEPKESVQPAQAEPDKAPDAVGSNPELLQLRSEITRLTQRKRELAGVTAENEQLRGQLASRGTNGARLLLPSKARMAGYNTPEDTLESLLWALQHHDLTNFLQAFAPELAQVFPLQVPEAWTNAMNEFHEKFAGISIIGRQELPGGRVELTVQLLGDAEQGQPLHFKQVNGQWKIENLK